MLLGAIIGGVVGLVLVLIKNAKQKKEDQTDSEILDDNDSSL